MKLFVLYLFILRPNQPYARVERPSYTSETECRMAGKKMVEFLGGYDKAKFTCIEKNLGEQDAGPEE